MISVSSTGRHWPTAVDSWSAVGPGAAGHVAACSGRRAPLPTCSCYSARRGSARVPATSSRCHPPPCATRPGSDRQRVRIRSRRSRSHAKTPPSRAQSSAPSSGWAPPAASVGAPTPGGASSKPASRSLSCGQRGVRSANNCMHAHARHTRYAARVRSCHIRSSYARLHAFTYRSCLAIESVSLSTPSTYSFSMCAWPRHARSH